MEDQSCIVGGCTDSDSSRFNPLATYDNGDCPVQYLGCTDSVAANYRAIANVEDNQCKYSGCTDSLAENFNPRASLPIPSSCSLILPGCTDSRATNYRAIANRDDGSCIYSGCTQSDQFNYDPSASVDSGLCQPFIYGCTDRRALNYGSAYNALLPGSCDIPGCLDSGNIFYGSEATVNLDCRCAGTCNFAPESDVRVTPIRRSRSRLLQTGSCCPGDNSLNFDSACVDHCCDAFGCSCCVYPLTGCTDSFATNYNPTAEAELEPSSCAYPLRAGCTIAEGTLNYDSLASVLDGCVYSQSGCTDSKGANYQQDANVDDSSCLFPIQGCLDNTAINYDSIATEFDGSCRFVIFGCARCSCPYLDIPLAQNLYANLYHFFLSTNSFLTTHITPV